MHQVPYKDPKKGLRNTGLRDARKLSLVPSVSGILDLLAKPGLVHWLRDQTLQAALDTPRISEETLEEFKARIRQTADSTASEAAQLGTEIHAALEEYFITGKVNPHYKEIIENVYIALGEKFGHEHDWKAEISFADELGYGGSCDLHCARNFGTVIDFKTKKFKEGKKPKELTYDEYGVQLAAYAYGLGIPHAVRANVLISTDDETYGQVLIHTWPDDTRHWKMFELLLELWKLVKGFDPSWRAA